MDFKRLHTFRIAAQTLNFSETAKRLNYVQSAVTSQIKGLEEELHTQLFDRNGRGVDLTQSGKRLLHYADRLLALREEAIDAVSVDEGIGGELRIAGHETILTYRLPPILKAFMDSYPEVRLIIQPIPVRALKRHLMDHNIDLGFILEEPFAAPDMEIHPIRVEEVVLIAAPDHPLTAKKGVTAADLIGETILLTERGCNYRNLFERTLIRAGAYNGPRLEFSSIEAVKSCAKLGAGIAAISRVSVEKEAAVGELAILDWADETLSVSLLMARSKRKRQSRAAKALMEQCLSQII